MTRKPRDSRLAGAMFLMATSAIGPGFITQTTQFTAQLGAAFAFAILVSILVDIALQLNVWRVIGVAGLRAQELGELVRPGIGHLLTTCVVVGGFVFNVGNVAGTGLGLDAMLDVPVRWGALLSALGAIAIFLLPRVGVAMDRAVVVLGIVMIAMTGYVVVVSHPPLVAAARNVLLPERIDVLAITTIIGGTVGGYITYAGAHRLIDSGVAGPDRVADIARASVTGVLITGLMRTLLFLAVLGVVAAGARLDPSNPTASAFQAAAGEIGRRVFGLILWSAAITSVIGASYTSVSFLTGRGPAHERRRRVLTVLFIAGSTAVYLALGAAPVPLLVFAGAFNGLILPVGIAVMLWIAWRRRDLLHGYRYPSALAVCGLLAWFVAVYLGFESLSRLRSLLHQG